MRRTGALKAGKAPSDAAVMELAERHRLSIDRWFYACNHQHASRTCVDVPKPMTGSGNTSTNSERV